VFAAQIEKPSVADEEQNEDSPDKVVDVTSADHDPVEWADVVRDEADEDSHAEKGNEKGEGGDEKAAARAVGNGGADQKADPGEMKEKKKSGDNEGGKEEENQCAGSDVHLSIETL
jgi:hypothetical protein